MAFQNSRLCVLSHLCFLKRGFKTVLTGPVGIHSLNSSEGREGRAYIQLHSEKKVIILLPARLPVKANGHRFHWPHLHQCWNPIGLLVDNFTSLPKYLLKLNWKNLREDCLKNVYSKYSHWKINIFFYSRRRRKKEWVLVRIIFVPTKNCFFWFFLSLGWWLI